MSLRRSKNPFFPVQEWRCVGGLNFEMWVLKGISDDGGRAWE